MTALLHYIDPDIMITSKGVKLNISYNSGECRDIAFTLSLPSQLRLRSLSDLSSRLFRCRIHHAVRIRKNIIVLIGFGMIYAYDLKANRLNPKTTPVSGKRSLNLCVDNTSHLYYGEYRDNQDRTPVHIYGSDSGGRRWKVVWRFTGVRHVHGVFHDSYDDKIWVTTGDEDKESGIWVTDDCFRTLDRVVGGTQQLRAVTLLFTQSHVYFGSDTPLERNFIYRLDRKTGKIDKLQEVESSVFWGCKVGESLFFSTAVEPSKANRCRDACIWGSKDGETWKCIARFGKDIWPMKLFQYGQIFFPAGENNSDYLWFTPFATEKHLTIQRLDIKEMF
ncbi:MAG: hypothetical protein JRJ45_05680 [Deltaproteobacteria bacterium]|nr:hypothetical protein [Deltaproteobacteria bacterium]